MKQFLSLKKILKYLVVFVAVCILGAVVVKRDYLLNYLQFQKTSNSIEENLSGPVLAEFSFQTGAVNRLVKSFHHVTLKINNTDDLDINKRDIVLLTDTFPLLLTVETWETGKVSPYLSNPHEIIKKGEYDNVIKKMCNQLINERPNVYVRLNPEVEVPANYYPWQRYYGAGFNEAFRHFSGLIRKYAPNAKVVWGPAGYPGALEYYPGDEFVDAVTLTLKSNSEQILDVYPKDYPVSYDLLRRLHRLRFLDKPIFVLGSTQIDTDSVNSLMVSSLLEKMSIERDIIYSVENFQRPTRQSSENEDKFELGVYDPQALLLNEDPITVEHLFCDFDNIMDGTFQNSFMEVVKRNHKVIVTVEPFHHPIDSSDRRVLQNITEGMYNEQINQLYNIVSSTKQMVYLRFAHEMEIPITRYPWQSQDPVTYIKSFRYFMKFIEPLPSNIKRVWGPAGDRGSLEWWPGNDVVDYISIAIYGLPDKNITDPEKQESFATIFNRKIWRMRFVDKPIFITEFGVKGPEDYQTKWLVKAAKVIRENPQIKGINYFNMTDTPKAWGEIEPPDWSITKKSFYAFVEALKGN